MKKFEEYLKAVIELYGTTRGNPCNLDDATVIKIGAKLRSLVAEEIIESTPN